MRITHKILTKILFYENAVLFNNYRLFFNNRWL